MSRKLLRLCLVLLAAGMLLGLAQRLAGLPMLALFGARALVVLGGLGAAGLPPRLGQLVGVSHFSCGAKRGLVTTTFS